LFRNFSQFGIGHKSLDHKIWEFWKLPFNIVYGQFNSISIILYCHEVDIKRKITFLAIAVYFVGYDMLVCLIVFLCA